MVTILAGLAEFERELILARTGDGRARAKARGVRFGRPAALTQLPPAPGGPPAARPGRSAGPLLRCQSGDDIETAGVIHRGWVSRPDIFARLPTSS